MLYCVRLSALSVALGDGSNVPASFGRVLAWPPKWGVPSLHMRTCTCIAPWPVWPRGGNEGTWLAFNHAILALHWSRWRISRKALRVVRFARTSSAHCVDICKTQAQLVQMPQNIHYFQKLATQSHFRFHIHIPFRIPSRNYFDLFWLII